MSERIRSAADQWWTINGADLLAGLRQAYEGTDPDIVYLELYVNSDSEGYGNEGE